MAKAIISKIRINRKQTTIHSAVAVSTSIATLSHFKEGRHANNLLRQSKSNRRKRADEKIQSNAQKRNSEI